MADLPLIIKILLAIIALPLSFLVTFFFIFLLVRGVNKLVYITPKAPKGKLFLILFLLAIALFFLVDVVLRRAELDQSLHYLCCYALACVLSYVLVPLLSLFLSNKKKRRDAATGPRKPIFNFKLLEIIGYVNAAIFFFLLIYTLSTNAGSDAKRIYCSAMFCCFALGLMCRRYPKIYDAQLKGLEELRGKSFALFLREFKRENDTFYSGHYQKEFGPTQLEISMRYNAGNLVPVNFETYFGHQFSIQIGKLVGLGKPGEKMPHESSNLIYASADWIEYLKFFFEHSKCIIMQPGISKHLYYELCEIKASGYSHKLYFLTRPRRRGLFNRGLQWLSDFATFPKAASWNDFQKILNKAGFTASIPYQHGAVIGFRDNDEAVLLKTNCKLPSDYVLAVKADLLNKTEGYSTIIRTSGPV